MVHLWLQLGKRPPRKGRMYYVDSFSHNRADKLWWLRIGLQGRIENDHGEQHDAFDKYKSNAKPESPGGSLLEKIMVENTDLCDCAIRQLAKIS